jgi:hypothetical protein
MMERRQFMQGLLTGVAGAVATVRLATPEETASLTITKPVMIGQPKMRMPDFRTPLVYVKTETGMFEVIGEIREFTIHNDKEEVTSWDGSVVVTNYGLRRDSLFFAGRL